jgi:hypothetical protein|tara:strand:- start:43452 stop:44543 length:1092 start_codon:yes stop_codon:yes gene_type:complete
LELAKYGFINTALKEQLAHLKSRDLLFQKDQGIVPVGRISVHEDENKLIKLLLGYNKTEDRAYMSFYNVNNCPVWHNYATSLLKETVQRLYPSISDHLFMKHRYFERDVEHLDSGIQKKLRRLFNGALQNIHSHNRYLKNGIQPIMLPVGKLPKLSNRLPIQFKQGPEGLFVPVTIGKNFVVLTPYLKVANEKNRLYLSVQEFRSLLEQKSISVLAETRYGVSLGIHGNKIYLKATDGGANTDSLKHWMLLDDFLESKNVPKRLKYEVAKNLVEKKDFMVVLDEIPIRATKDILLLKKHYASGRTYFAVKQNGKKPKPADYRPITDLRDKYPQHYAAYREYVNKANSLQPLRAKEKRGINISF